MHVLPLIEFICGSYSAKTSGFFSDVALLHSKTLKIAWTVRIVLFIMVLSLNVAILGCTRRSVCVGRFDLVQLFPPFRCVCSLRTRLPLCLKITIVSVSSSFPLQSPPISRLPSPRRRLILDTVCSFLIPVGDLIFRLVTLS